MTFIPLVEMPERLATLLDHARPTAATAAGWYRIENAEGGDDDTATMMLYSEIGGFFGVDLAEFAKELAGVTAKNILLRIDSPGGAVSNGIAMANLLRSHPAHVTVSVDGMAASIASVIAMAGDEIIMQPGSELMVHRAWGLCVGNMNDMAKMGEVLTKQDVKIAKAYAARAGGRYDTWLRRMDDETWFSAEEAVAVGLADKAIPYPKRKGEPDEPDMATAARATPRVWDLSVFRYAGRDEAPTPNLDNESPAGSPAPHAGDAAAVPVSAGQAAPEWLTPEGVRGAVREAVADLPVAVAVDTDGITAGVMAAFRRVLAEAGVVSTAVGPHEGAAQDGTWDADAQLKRLSWPIPVATARRVFAWYDSARVEDGKVPRDACSLPHHFVGEDGTPGAPSRNGINAALARLDQTDGPTEAEKETIRRHLRAHLPSDDSDDKAAADSAVQLDAPAVTTPNPPAARLTFGRRTDDQPPRTLVFGMRRS